MKPPLKLCKAIKCPRPRLKGRKLCYTHFLEQNRLIKRLQSLERAKKRKERSKKYQKSETKKWHAKCWKLMSEWVRRKDADWKGNVHCYTCNKEIHWTEAHAAHRFHGRLDFDERNLKPCCVKCNTYLHGNLGEYERRLICEYGPEWSKKLFQDASQHPGYELPELQSLYETLKKKLDAL